MHPIQTAVSSAPRVAHGITRRVIYTRGRRDNLFEIDHILSTFFVMNENFLVPNGSCVIRWSFMPSFRYPRNQKSLQLIRTRSPIKTLHREARKSSVIEQTYSLYEKFTFKSLSIIVVIPAGGWYSPAYAVRIFPQVAIVLVFGQFNFRC